MPRLSDEVEELLLVISASGFDWVAAIARTKILASGTALDDDVSETSKREAEQLSIVQSVLEQFR